MGDAGEVGRFDGRGTGPFDGRFECALAIFGRVLGLAAGGEASRAGTFASGLGGGRMRNAGAAAPRRTSGKLISGGGNAGRAST